jgi:hypothetical protein
MSVGGTAIEICSLRGILDTFLEPDVVALRSIEAWRGIERLLASIAD